MKNIRKLIADTLISWAQFIYPRSMLVAEKIEIINAERVTLGLSLI